MIYDWILLTCFKNINGERTSSSIYHLLKGKRSIQTVQDAHLFKLDSFYGIYKRLKKNRFDAKIEDLMQNRLIECNYNENDMTFTITTSGESFLKNAQIHNKFNGLLYYEKSDIFTHRLLLLIQTLTNSKMGFFSFIPVINLPEVERWVKVHYKKMKGKESKLLQKIYDELTQVLCLFTDKESSIFVQRLTGYENYGMSVYQLSEIYDMTEDDVYLLLESMNHQILKEVESNPNGFSFLWYVIKDLLAKNHLTQSANETYQYLKNGFTAEQIAYRRNLKVNTIYDHIVEIALYTDYFPIRDYVSEKVQNEIMEARIQADSNKLKAIKKIVSASTSYFQIRLVLAIENKLQK
ncbi:helix-turn-helix domain-containing protein [Oceanobacillus senegalensis]|uniref:helix-turn-helix domain-containing protein n=1 Tax=Oceanobacillus senegalensis TaxID=1936063 RepID=UPI000A313D04|nr:helix-turn-helix domain-containing protein [Oceanobacillus senegalensis]